MWGVIFFVNYNILDIEELLMIKYLIATINFIDCFNTFSEAVGFVVFPDTPLSCYRRTSYGYYLSKKN